MYVIGMFILIVVFIVVVFQFMGGFCNVIVFWIFGCVSNGVLVMLLVECIYFFEGKCGLCVGLFWVFEVLWYLLYEFDFDFCFDDWNSL